MKKIVKQSIWVIFLNIFIGTILLGILIGFIKYIMGETDFLSIFTIGILGTFIGFITYGLFLLFIPLLLLLYFSSIIFVKDDSDISNIRNLLTFEFIIVGSILTILVIRSDFYFGLSYILIFGISQYRRLTIIKKELKTQPNI